MTSNIKFAELNKKITVEIAKHTPNSVGGSAKSWEWQCLLWGALNKFNTKLVNMSRVQQKNSHTLILRYTKTLRALINSVDKPQLKNVRFKYENLILIPESIKLDENERYVIISTIED